MKQLPNWQIQMQNHENKSWVGQSTILLTPQPLFTIFLSSLCFVLNCLLLFLIFVLSYIIKLLFFFLWLFLILFWISLFVASHVRVIIPHFCLVIVLLLFVLLLSLFCCVLCAVIILHYCLGIHYAFPSQIMGCLWNSKREIYFCSSCSFAVYMYTICAAGVVVC